MVRLGVNIDHVATLRQARGETYPDLQEAARICLREGAHQITIHLREDRRHIQDNDVKTIRRVTQEFGRPLNLEMGCHEDILAVAIREKPDWICLVPEKREEKTTEGGLNLLDKSILQKVRETCERIKREIPDCKISLFLEGQEEVLLSAIELAIDAVEIHTGEYARAFNQSLSLQPYWNEFAHAQKFLKKHSLGCHAGHGLTYHSVLPLLEKGFFEEYNIGHWIICESLFHGLSQVIRKLKGQFDADCKFPGNERY